MGSKLRNSPNISLLIIALIFALISACEQKQSGVAAPLNELSALEKLATAYEKLSEEIPVSPANLAPKARKKFVSQVFRNAGFGYFETLQSLSSVNSNEITKLHRDMQELLFLPHYGLQQRIMKEIYNEEERILIEKIKLNFK